MQSWQSFCAQYADLSSLALDKNWIFIWRSTKFNHMLINFKNKVVINYFQVFTKVCAPVGVPFKASHYFSTFSEMDSESVSWRAYVVRNRIRYMPWLGLSPKNSLCAIQKPVSILPVKHNGYKILVWSAVVLTMEKSWCPKDMNDWEGINWKVEHFKCRGPVQMDVN